MNYLSVCSGIEAASVAWHGLGWSPVAFSEIEAFPSAVLKHRFPDTPNWGDMTKYEEWPDICVCDPTDVYEPGNGSQVTRRGMVRGRDVHAGGDEYEPRDSVCDPSEHGGQVGHGGMHREGMVGRGRKLHARSDGQTRDRDNTNGDNICEKCGNFKSIDLICGGTPCQSFSVAGLRKGLDDERGNLMLTFGHILAKYRPRWFVWENVPGVLSSNAGRDFASFLGLVTGQAIEPPADGWRNSGAISGIESAYDIAYRVLDAQYTRSPNYPRAVPQRRRRVFVVGHLGDWRRAAAVLLDSEGVSRNPPPSRKAGQRVAGTLKGGSGERGYPDPSDGNGGGLIDVRGFTGTSFGQYSEGCGTLRAEVGDLGGGSETVIAQVYENHPQDSRINGPLDVNPTVDARYGTGGGNVPLVVQSSWWDGGQVASSIATRSHDQNMPDKDNFGAVIHKTAVRRLLPVECERLQGFPDGWTDIPYRGKPNSPDGQRYKAIGNSMATNVMGWIGRRIQMVDEI